MAETTNIQALKTEADRLRVHSIRMTTAARSGHPTSCMSAAEIVSCLFFRVMRWDPKDPHSVTADRFVLSKGHAAPVLYAALAEAGAIPQEQLMTLRQISSDLEGHPTPRCPWTPIGTGSLGQGLSVGMGMAFSRKCLEKNESRIYVLLGDGEIAEGAVWEAAALAAYYKLDNLVAIVDVNRLGQSQATMAGHNVGAYAARFGGFGWRTVIVDGHDCEQLLNAFDDALRVKDQPVALIAETIKGKGFAEVADKNGFHGKPLTDEQAEEALREIGAAAEPAEIHITPPPAGGQGCSRAAEIQAPEPPVFKKGDLVATRQAYGQALVDLGKLNPQIVALDGDVKNSTFAQEFAEACPERYVECFIAEQNMVGAAMGLAACGKLPFVSSFGAFIERALDQVRMAGVSRANLKLVGSHAGVSIGEDGPSQMALEDLAFFRTVPGAVVLYPSDPVAAYKLVVQAARHQGMAFVRTSRPKTPVIYDNTEEFPIGGLKVLRSSAQDRICIAGAGVTLHEALKAYEALKSEGIAARIIDLYSIKPLPADELADNVREAGGTVIVVEDHYPEGGMGDAAAAALAPHRLAVHKLAVCDVPRSGKGDELMDAFGIGAAGIARRARELLA